MPFGFGRKKDEQASVDAEAEGAAADRREARPVEFFGLTEEWRLRGTMTIKGRILETLNKREAIPLSHVTWAPLDGSTPFESVPGIQTVDPYDLIIVIAGAESLDMSDEERLAHRVHKVPFDVALEAPPIRIVGTVRLYPGSEPEGLLERATQMFVAITNPTVTVGGTEIELDEGADAVLVNRAYLRGVEQVDLTTGEPHHRLPGVPLGGTTWQDRTR